MTFFKMSIYARSGRLGLPHESLPCISARFWSVPLSGHRLIASPRLVGLHTPLGLCPFRVIGVSLVVATPPPGAAVPVPTCRPARLVLPATAGRAAILPVEFSEYVPRLVFTDFWQISSRHPMVCSLRVR